MNVAGTTRPRPRSFAYPAILALSALDAAGYSVISPLLPAISASTGAGPATLGALAATFPLGILVGFPLAGGWIQRRNAGSLVVAGCLLLAGGAVAFIASDRLGAYFAGRLVMGLGSGALWMGITYTTLERWPGQEYRCMSRVFAAYSAGALLGPALGAPGGVEMPFAAYAMLAILGAASASFMRRPSERRNFVADRTALRAPGFLVASIGIGFAVLALGVIDGVLPLHLGSELTQSGIAVLFVGVAIVHAAGATLGGRIAPRRALVIACVLAVAGVGLAGAVSGAELWFPALALAGVGVGFGETGSVGILLGAVPVERSVSAMVLGSQIGIVGYIAGPLAGGVLAEHLGVAWLFLVPLAGAVPVLRLLAGRG